mmetsp:Transcript_558/g.957  ORF Transcript_558/g.957 Transcript_558/m.957 type:complete len:85 (-) Transcript_558:1152-1406(-)
MRIRGPDRAIVGRSEDVFFVQLIELDYAVGVLVSVGLVHGPASVGLPLAVEAFSRHGGLVFDPFTHSHLEKRNSKQRFKQTRIK